MHLVSIVLSGGAGTRLWPVSRQALPKPFMQLGGSSLLQQAIERGQACGTDDTLIVTNQDYLFLTRNVIDELADPPHARYLLEPKGRNTAPAIALAALACAQEHGPEAVMLVLPADHLIPDTEAFVANALEAARHAQQGRLVVFGISPTAPETGFGYIEVEKAGRSAQQALRFLLNSGEAVDLGEDVVLLKDHFDRARDAIMKFIRERGPATTSDLRQMLGTSRRILIPLLERLDRDGVTRREGDKRVLKK